MKAGEIANLLRKTADILDYYEDNEMLDVLDNILFLVKENSKETKKNSEKERKSSKKDSEEIIDKQQIISAISQMDKNELEYYLNNDKIFQSREVLLAIAKEMSIVSSNRQTIAALKHSIVKYFERQNMDQLIRFDRNE
jgi:hypothetical protein